VRELSQHVLDLLENSLGAGATRVDLEIVEDSAQNRLCIRVQDNGRGMDEQMLARVTDPFFTTRTTRDVGLCIPLLKAAAQRCNGDLTIASTVDVGTCVEVVFDQDHIDRAPLGDMQSTLLGAVLSVTEPRICYTHRVDGREFAFDTAEIREALGDVPLSHPRVRDWFIAFMTEGFRELRQGT